MKWFPVPSVPKWLALFRALVIGCRLQIYSYSFFSLSHSFTTPFGMLLVFHAPRSPLPPWQRNNNGENGADTSSFNEQGLRALYNDKIWNRPFTMVHYNTAVHNKRKDSVVSDIASGRYFIQDYGLLKTLHTPCTCNNAFSYLLQSSKVSHRHCSSTEGSLLWNG